MTSPPLTDPNARFALETHDHEGVYTATIPYKNLQMEMFMGSRGCTLRADCFHRGYDTVTQANLYSGKHEIWLMDYFYSRTKPLFAGPIWDLTPSSQSGLIALQAQDAISYLAKRRLKVDKTYTATQPADIITDLITYANSQRALKITNNKQTSNAQTINQKYLATDRNQISDLLKKLETAGDGVDYYMRHDGTTNQFMVYGGLKKPTPNPRGLEYGGGIYNYSIQYTAAGITNDDDFIGNNGVIGNAADTSKQTEYDALYQVANTSTDLTALASLNQAAAVDLKKYKSTLIVPTFTSKTIYPLIDFEFGDQFTAVINDGWVQYNGIIRVIGCQLTLGPGDSYTLVLYTNDNQTV